MKVPRFLLDLAACIYLLPKNLCDKFKFRGLEKIFWGLLLADGSIKQLLGILEGVMVRLKQCVFHIDFIAMEMSILDCLSVEPIIFVRPFLVIGRKV